MGPPDRKRSRRDFAVFDAAVDVVAGESGTSSSNASASAASSASNWSNADFGGCGGGFPTQMGRSFDRCGSGYDAVEPSLDEGRLLGVPARLCRERLERVDEPGRLDKRASR